MENCLAKTPSMEIYKLSDLLFEVRRIRSEFLDGETYRKDVVLMQEIVLREEHNFKGVLMDNRELVFTLSPEIQRWINEEIFPSFIRKGLRYGAFAVSKDIFTNISVQQALAEDEAKPFVITYYDNTEDARKWLDEKMTQYRSA
jgi:hypothetical protein